MQRRHQKIIEEGAGAGIPERLIERLASACPSLQKIGYRAPARSSSSTRTASSISSR